MTMFRSRLMRMAGGRRRQPWYVGGATSIDTTSVGLTSLTGGYWGAAAEGDVVVVVSTCTNAAQNPTISTSGYTTIANLTQGSLRTVVAYKCMTSTPDTTVAANAGDRQVMAAYVWRGLASGSEIDATTTTAKATSTAMANPAITTATSAAIVLMIGASLSDGLANPPTRPAGFVNIARRTNSYGFLPSRSSDVAAAYISHGQAGVFASQAWTSTASVLDWCAVTVALKPA